MNIFALILLLYSTSSYAAPPTGLSEGVAFVFKARLSTDAGSLDWGHGEVNSLVVQQLMRGLTHSTNNNTTSPALATHWVYENNNTRIRFYLRKNARWSDGAPVCGQHFIDAWTRALSPTVSSPYAHYFDFIEGAKNFRASNSSQKKLHVSTRSCHELIVNLAQPGRLAHHIFSHWVFFPVRIDQIEKYGKDAFSSKHLLVTGPYGLHQWVADQKYTLLLNPWFYGDRPKTPHVEFLVVSDDNTALNLFKTGAIHWMKDLPYQDVKRLQKEPGFSSTQSAIGYFLGFNNNAAPFNNAIVRCGISHALDTNEIPTILTGLETPALRQWVPTTLKNAVGSIPKVTENSKKTAQNYINQTKRILAEFTKNGGTLPKIEFYNKDIHIPLMTWVQSQLQKKLNTSFELLINDGNSYWQKLESAPPALFLSGTTAWFHHPYAFLSEFLSVSVANWGKYSSQIYDSQVLKTLSIHGATQQALLVRKAENTILNSDCAIVPLYFRHTAELLSTKCSNLNLSTLGTLDISSVTCSQ